MERNIKIFGILILVFSNQLQALETDQYMVWDRQLKDSSLELNKFVNNTARNAITQINSSEKYHSCQEVHKKIIDEYIQDGVITAIENWAYETPLIEKYPMPPNGKKKLGAVVKQTIYRDSLIFKLKIFAININVNGIYIGIDKLAHILQTGFGQYKKYQKKIKKGYSIEEATAAAIRKGVFQEKTYYGYRISGVFSFADLEANYQGLLLNKRFCDGDETFLGMDKNEKWILKKEIDMREYINPYLDESYNPNTYTKRRARKIRPYVKRYCESRFHPAVIARMEEYRARSVPSFSYYYLQKMVSDNELKNPADTGIDSVCEDYL